MLWCAHCVRCFNELLLLHLLLFLLLLLLLLLPPPPPPPPPPPLPSHPPPGRWRRSTCSEWPSGTASASPRAHQKPSAGSARCRRCRHRRLMLVHSADLVWLCRSAVHKCESATFFSFRRRRNRGTQQRPLPTVVPLSRSAGALQLTESWGCGRWGACQALGVDIRSSRLGAGLYDCSS